MRFCAKFLILPKFQVEMVKTKLIETRKRKNISQEHMAAKLCMDVSNYSRREKGQVRISNDEWQKLATFLEVPLEDIYEAEESQIFIFNDNATGNGNILNNYNIPMSLWESQKKYLEKLEQEIQLLKEENATLKSQK